MTPALREILERFDALPDAAVVPSKVTAIILGMSERTVRYHPDLSKVQISANRYGQRAGDIRKLCREGATEEAQQLQKARATASRKARSESVAPAV
jgi:hypothetical protein